MRVLMINVVCGIRSTGRICVDLAEALSKQGHAVKIAYGREKVPGQYRKYSIRIGNNLDVFVHAGLARLTDSVGFHSIWYTKQLIKWVERFDPDVIHLHNIHGYYINVEVLFRYLRTCGKRIIWTLHDCWAFTGHSVYCDAINCLKWQVGCHHCPQISEYPKSYIDRSQENWKRKKRIFTGIRNLQIITPSHWLAGMVRKSYLKDYPVAVIHNGIDTSQFYPLDNDFRKFYHLEDKIIILGVASTWNKIKGLDDYVKLSMKLDNRFKIVLVGLNQSQIEDLSSTILGIPKTASTKELSMMYSACDVFLNLTYTDTYPNINLEASACGARVIAYDAESSLESIEEYDNSITIPRGDIENVITTLYELFENKMQGSLAVSHDESNRDKDHTEAIEEYKLSLSEGYFLNKKLYGLIGKRVILAVSALWEDRKGLKDIVKIVKDFSLDYQMVVIGVDDRQKAILPSEVIAINRTNNVEELQVWYALSDLYINPTYEDNYPTTNLEAISCGTPVITYNTGGSGESVENTNGMVINKGQHNLMNAIEDSKNNFEMICFLQKRKDFIGKEVFLDSYLKLY